MRTRVKVQVPGMQPYITCGATACDIVFQVLTIQPEASRAGIPTQDRPSSRSPEEKGRCTGRAQAGARRPSTPGAGFLQPSTEVHNMRNEAPTPLVLHAFYFCRRAQTTRPFGSPSAAD